MKIFKKILILLSIFFLIFVSFFFIGEALKAEENVFGVTFSPKYAQKLGLNWQETYLALLDELEVKKLRIVLHWDLLEPQRGEYNFDDTDWMLDEAEKRGAGIILIAGMKTPRWPECHIPLWAVDIGKEKQQEAILEEIEKVILRYKDRENITHWQVENEPSLRFGECPWYDKEFFLKEVELVRRLDPKRPILVTESGELSFWFGAAKTGDVVGTTMYRQTWWHRAGGLYIKYPLPPVHYWRKAQLIKWFFGKEVICVELQAEPWGPVPVYHGLSLEEQEKSMNLKKFRENIEYAKRTGLRTFYLWGAEWWFWLKVKHNNPDIWNEARELFITPEAI